jgi:DNA mismatch repair protein MutS2
MQSAVLRALEFDRIVEMVRGFAMTPMGDERLALLAPSNDRQQVAHWLAATTETTKYLAANNLFPLRASAELPQTLAALAVEGRALEPGRLLSLAAFLDSVDETKTAIRRASGAFTHLEAATGTAASFSFETAQVRGKIDPAGDVVDDASPELKHVRERLK